MIEQIVFDEFVQQEIDKTIMWATRENGQRIRCICDKPLSSLLSRKEIELKLAAAIRAEAMSSWIDPYNPSSKNLEVVLLSPSVTPIVAS